MFQKILSDSSTYEDVLLCSPCLIDYLGHPISISQFFSQLYTLPGGWALRTRTGTDWISQVDHNIACVSWACGSTDL